MNKGQIFSMDALVAILGITIILGLVTSQFSLLFDQYQEDQFELLDSIASDMANIGVANIMAKEIAGVKRTAIIDAGKIQTFTTFLEQTLAPEYGGYVVIPGSAEVDINGGCELTQMKSVERRLVLNGGQVGWLHVAVCYKNVGVDNA